MTQAAAAAHAAFHVPYDASIAQAYPVDKDRVADDGKDLLCTQAAITLADCQVLW
jgi:hypothetical protein